MMFHRILTALILALLHHCFASNYDDYIARLVAESEAVHREFIQSNPHGQFVLDKLSSPDYLNQHPVLGEVVDGDYDIEPKHWRAFLQELQDAKLEAARPLEDGEVFHQPRRRWYAPEHLDIDDTAEATSRRNEVPYQNYLWGEHKVSGGTGESGQWLEFALQGAKSQDTDEEDQEDSYPHSMMDAANDSLGHLGFFETKYSSLPSYCDPPNPCPIGYDPETLPTPCDPHIIPTKEFNRNWILAKQENGECSCDTEHMFSCNAKVGERRPHFKYVYQPDEEIQNQFDNPYLQGLKRKRLVAKKAFPNKKAHSDRHYYWQGQVTKRVVKKAGPAMA